MSLLQAAPCQDFPLELPQTVQEVPLLEISIDDHNFGRCGQGPVAVDEPVVVEALEAFKEHLVDPDLFGATAVTDALEEDVDVAAEVHYKRDNKKRRPSRSILCFYNFL